MPTMAAIKKLISNNKTKEALSSLMDYCKALDPKYENDLILLNARFTSIYNDAREGKLTNEKKSVELVKLNDAILEFMDTLPSKPIQEPSRWLKFLWSIKRLLSQKYSIIEKGLIFLLLLTIGILFYLKKHDLSTQFTIKANRIAFSQNSNWIFDLNKKFEYIELIQFKNITIPAKEAFIHNRDENVQQQYNSIKNGNITIFPIANLEPSVLFSDVALQSLQSKASTEMAFTIAESPDAEEHILEIDAVPGSLEGNMIFQDSLFFDCSDSFIANLDSNLNKKQPSWLEGSVHITDDRAGVIKFLGDSGRFKLLLELDDSVDYSLTDPQIDIDSIRFMRPGGPGYSKSSIINGTISFLNNKGAPFDSQELNRSDILRIQSNNKLDVTYFAITKNEISIKLVGKVHKLFYGPSRDEVRLINPSLINWFWESYGIVVGLPAILLIVLGLIPRLFFKTEKN